jgi:hypothetical protein
VLEKGVVVVCYFKHFVNSRCCFIKIETLYFTFTLTFPEFAQ